MGDVATAHILGIGTARPGVAVAQSDAAAFAARRCGHTRRHERLLRELYRRTTVQQRGICLLEPGEDLGVAANRAGWFYPPAGATGGPGSAPQDRGPTTAQRMEQFRRRAPDLAAQACTGAVNDGSLQPEQITHLVVVTCTGFAAPGVEIALIKRLGLPRTVKRTLVGFMGCHGALNGLQIATNASLIDPCARVLVCCVELGSIHFQYGWDVQQVVANALFADGAAAIVVGQSALPRPGQWHIADTASYLIVDTEQDMSWDIGDHGFVMKLSPRVPQLISDHVRPWLDEWLRRHTLSVSRIRSWSIHAGGPRVVGAVADRLGLDASAVAACRRVLRDHGNMSSATVLFILKRLRDQGADLPCVTLSFGPGLCVEAALLTDGGGGGSSCGAGMSREPDWVE